MRRMIKGIVLIVLLASLLYLAYEILYFTYETGYNTACLGNETRKYNQYNLDAKAFKALAFRNFKSEEELKTWLSKDKIDRLKWEENIFECDKFVELLVIHAFEDGYIVFSTTGNILKFGELATYGYFEIPINNVCELKMHAWNYCYIKDLIYWIEPQTDQILNTKKKEL